ncbi:MAG: hypothetical protein V1660_02725 [archaeon]
MTRKKISIKNLRNILLTFLAFMLFAFFSLGNVKAASITPNIVVDISMRVLFVVSIIILVVCLIVLAKELFKAYRNRHNRQVLS